MMFRVQGYAHQHLVIPLVKTRLIKRLASIFTQFPILRVFSWIGRGRGGINQGRGCILFSIVLS